MASAGRIAVSQATFTPAAGAHGAGDVWGAATEFKGLSTSLGTGVQIISASLLVASAAVLTTTWRVHLYNVTPPSALADNAVFDIPAGDQAAYLGFVDIAQLAPFTSSQFIQSDNLNKSIRSSGYSVYGYLVATSAITAANVAHTVTLHAMG